MLIYTEFLTLTVVTKFNLPEMLEAATPFNTLDKFDFFSDVTVACTVGAVIVVDEVVMDKDVCPAVLGSKITPDAWLM